MMRRVAPRRGCTWCKGSGIVSVSKDPDEIADCVCTDPIDPEDVVVFAETVVGVELMPWQRHVMDRALAGDQIVVGRGRRG